jgi:hypothetical protein
MRYKIVKNLIKQPISGILEDYQTRLYPFLDKSEIII